MIGVAIRDARTSWPRFLRATAIPIAGSARTMMSQVQLALGSSGVPETFIVDGKGVIRYQHIGEIRPEHVAMLLDKLQTGGPMMRLLASIALALLLAFQWLCRWPRRSACRRRPMPIASSTIRRRRPRPRR